MKKTYRIKSRVRFTAFVLVALFAVTGIFNTVIGSFNASGAEYQDYMTIEVTAGDTLWTIASSYMPSDMDTRQAVHIIQEMNDISNVIEPGMIIKVPVLEQS